MSQDPGDINSAFGFSAFGGRETTLGSFVNLITPILFTIASMMVFFYFLIGAFELITSQGEKGHIVSARSKIYHAFIGLVLLIFLFLTLEYLLPALGVTGLKLFRQ